MPCPLHKALLTQLQDRTKLQGVLLQVESRRACALLLSPLHICPVSHTSRPTSLLRLAWQLPADALCFLAMSCRGHQTFLTNKLNLGRWWV